MKRILQLIVILCLMTGCSAQQDTMEQVLQLRGNLSGQAFSFVGRITADYGDVVYQFTLSCQADEEGVLRFTVDAPEEIAGIGGWMDVEGGKMEFEDTILAFSFMADGQISPVAAPWVMVRALTSGYITSTGRDGEWIRATINDTYQEDSFTVDIWIDEAQNPVRCEILWKNRRILTMEMENFRIG